jgi:glycerol-3-phosphate dehydrogenase (NAD(P)+)
MSIVTFIGAGQMASALSFPVTDNGHTVRLVGTPLDRDIINTTKKTGFHPTLKRQLPKNRIEYFQIEDLETALINTDLILCGVSSFGVNWFAKTILPQLPIDIPILSVTKGLIDQKDGSVITYPDYFLTQFPENKRPSINAIGGPCTSYELADKDHSCVAFCGKDLEILRFIKSIFKTKYYHISLSTDVIGVESAVALKNAYALGVSLAIGLSKGPNGLGIEHYNSQAGLFSQSIKEMTLLINYFGGKSENIIYGAGDLYVTIFGGRTRKIGTLLGQGFSFDTTISKLQGVTLESIVISTRTARSVRNLAKRGCLNLKDFPLLLHVDDIINQNASVNIPWESFES